MLSQPKTNGLRRIPTCLLLPLIVVATVALVALSSAEAQVTSVGGDAYGERVSGAVKSGPIPQVTLPSAGGGPFVATLADIEAGTTLNSGTLRVSTEGGKLATAEGFSKSSARVSNLDVGGNVVTADVVAANCRSVTSGSIGTTSAVNLRVGGVRLVSAKVNQAINLPGVARVVVNEQVSAGKPGTTSLVVNALHITLFGAVSALDQDIIVSHVSCNASGPDVNGATTTSSSTSSTTSTSTTATTQLGKACPCSIFENNQPDLVDAGDGGVHVTLGVKFEAHRSGQVIGVRFYKSAANTGTHMGTLWSRDGLRLATGTFASETTEGWQELRFDEPVPIQASTTYIVSYFTTAGHYSFTSGFFMGSEYVNEPLVALADGEDGPNGVFNYADSDSFPNQTFGAANYWVDVLFQ